MKKIIVLFIILFTSFSLFSLPEKKSLNHYFLKNFTISQGLPSNDITVVYQSKDGYLWIGTKSGLSKFDGKEFKNFDKRNVKVFTSSFIKDIKEDEKGILWIATKEGLFFLKDNIFYSAEKSGITLPSTKINSISFYKNRMWIASFAGLSEILNKKVKTHTIANGLPEKEIIFLKKYQDKLIAFSKNGKIFQIVVENNKTTFKNFTKKIFRQSVIDENGYLWFISKNSLFRQFKNQKPQNMSKNTLLEKKNLFIISKSKDGILWLGTDDGLLEIKNGLFTTYTINDGLSTNFVYAVLEDKLGQIWIGSKGGGLNVFKNNKFRHITTKNGLLSNIIGGITEDSRGNIWIGTSKGINKISSKTLKVLKSFTKKDGLVTDVVGAVFEDSKGNIWAGTLGGNLFILKKNKFVIVRRGALFRGNIVRDIKEDKNHNLWIASTEGLIKFSNGRFKRYFLQNGLPGNVVLSIFVDSNNDIWITILDKGIVLLKNEKFYRITTKNGLFSDTIFGIVQTQDNFFWMSSIKGIFKISQKDLENTIENPDNIFFPEIFDKEDGLKRIKCTGGLQPSILKRANGELVFPTVEGISFINPMQKENLPKLFLKINNVTADELSILNKHSLPKNKAKKITFYFDAPLFFKHNKLFYLYKLENFDTNWQKTTSNSVSYTNLSSGKYVFKVKAFFDLKNKANTSMQTFSFEIKPTPNSSQNSDGSFSIIIFILSIFSTSLTAFILYRSNNSNKKNKEIKNSKQTQKTVEQQVETDSKQEEHKKRKYEKSKIDDETAKYYAQELEKIMKEEKLYKNPDLTLPELAKKLNISTNILSQVLNGFLNKNFYTYINTFRVEEVKAALKNPKNKDVKILNIAYDAGFKSKTTFNNFFKELTGKTPSEFKKDSLSS